MKKKNAKSLDPALREIDPRARDPAMLNRIKRMVEDEVLHQAWGCALWRLERVGYIESDQRRAGDEYQRIVLAGRRALDWDIDRFPPEVQREMERTIKLAMTKWEEARKLLRFGDDGIGIQLAVDDLCIDEIYPATEKEKQRVSKGLWRLAHFFGYRSKSGIR